MAENSNLFSEARHLADSPAGRALLALLEQSGGDPLRQAAASGDLDQVQALLCTLLRDPEARALLEQLEDSR